MRLLYHPYFDDLILELNCVFRTRLVLVDGTYFLNKTGPMLGGIPVRKDLIIGSDDIGATDLTLCRIMGLDISKIRYLRNAQEKGWIPSEDKIQFKIPPQTFCDQKFYLKRSLRSWAVCWAFDRPWAVNLIWNSSFGEWMHKILYRLQGNPVADTVQQVKSQS